MPRRKPRQSGEIDAWSKHIHELIDEMSNRMFFEFRSSRTWQPRVNVYATQHALLVCLEIAGLDPGGITLEGLAPTRVRLTGLRVRPAHPEDRHPFSVEMMEIDEGPFERIVDLPEAVDVGHASVNYERGFLWITIPKTEAS